MRSLNSAKFPASFKVGIVILSIITLLILGAPIIASHDPIEQNSSERLQKPSNEHPLGTDRFGRDLFSRTLYGGKTTLIAAFLALGAAVLIGLVIGLVTGMFRGSVIDIIFMRLMDVLLAFPFMVLALVIAGIFGTNFVHLLIAVVSVWWVSFARLTRSVVLFAQNDTSFAAARILGARPFVIIVRELLPKVLSPVFILATFELGSLILSITALSFLGLGAQPPTPEWGSILADGRDHFLQAPHILIGPTVSIILTVFAFNLIGEGLRDRLDPYEITKR